MSKSRRKRHARMRLARDREQAHEMEQSLLPPQERDWPRGFSISGTVTGRTSSREPNLQNLPRHYEGLILKDYPKRDAQMCTELYERLKALTVKHDVAIITATQRRK